MSMQNPVERLQAVAAELASLGDALQQAAPPEAVTATAPVSAAPAVAPAAAEAAVPGPPVADAAAINPANLSPEQALALFGEDPVEFVATVAEFASRQNLTRIRDEAELKASLSTARQKMADFSSIEGSIMAEVDHLIATDKDGIIDPWPVLFEKAYNNVQAALKGQLTALKQEQPEVAAQQATPVVKALPRG